MKVSIITVTFNSALTIKDTFDSVFFQTYTNIEYIVIDGASIDGTTDIIKSYHELFNGKLHFVSEPDNGMYDAMNKGIMMATGDIIGILNSDDFYSSNMVIENIVKELRKCETDAIYGDVHYVNHKNLERCVRYYSSRFFHPQLMRLGFMPAHPSFYCKKSIYLKYGAFELDYKIAADFECLLRFIYINKVHIRYLPMDFVTMRVGGASSASLKSHQQILKDHLKAYKKHNITSNVIFESLRYVYKIMEIIVQRLRIFEFFHFCTRFILRIIYHF